MLDDQQQPEDEQACGGYTFERGGREVITTPKIEEFVKQQSVPVKGSDARRSPRVSDGVFFDTLFDDVHTVHEMFLRGYRVSKESECLGWREKNGGPYKWLTYQEVFDRVKHVGSGLIAKGMVPKSQSQFMGIYSQNCVEWVLMDRACAGYSIISVPLYDTLGDEALVHIMNQCEMDVILIDTNAKAKKVMDYAKVGKTSPVRLLIMVEEPDDEIKSLANDLKVEVMTEKALEDLGGKSPKEFIPPKPGDLYTICYTSGTTGIPKGAMHTNESIVSIACAFLVNAGDYSGHITPDDIHISYLPLPHVFERYVLIGTMMHGAKIGFYRGDPKKLLEDAVELKPTIFLLVPRLVNRIYAKIMSAVGQSGVKRMVFDFCLNRKMAALKRGSVTKDTFWDKILFHKFQAVLGGRVRLSVTGAAPISVEVLNVVRCVMGVPIFECYGQTETTGGFTATLCGDFEGGNVGSITPCAEVKLIDVPDKNYFAKDGKGEICCRGLAAFSGYYKDEEKTKETLDSDGWVYTGDVGQWMPNGTLKIIDRKKNILKLSQGEYVSPEKVEQIYNMSEPLLQVYVHGNSLKSSVVALVVPDEEVLSTWLKGKDFSVGQKSFPELCGEELVEKLILEDMNKIGRQNGLKSFELAKKLHLSAEQFTIENNLLTPSLKNRRIQIAQKYQTELQELYSELD